MKILLLVSSFCVFLFLFSDSQAQWIKTKGIYYGEIGALTTNGTTIFASTGEGVFRSTDSGESWLNVGPFDTTDLNSGVLYSYNGNVFVGIGGKGIYMTPDNGESWNNIGPSGAITISMYVKDNLIISGLMAGQFFLSTNMGTSWALKNMPFPYDVRCFTNINNKIFAGSVNQSGPGGQLFVSTNYGNNWYVVEGGLPQNPAIHSITSCDSKIILSSSEGIYRSSDLGVTWQLVNSSLTFRSFTVVGTTIFATTGLKIFKSIDYGDNWIQLNNGLPEFGEYNGIYCLTNEGTNIFAGSMGEGVFRSSNQGEDWQKFNNGLQNIPIICMHSNNEELILGSGRGNGVYTSSDAGNNWTQSGLSGVYNQAITRYDSLIFVSSYLDIYRSTDKGISWATANVGLPQSNINCLATSGSIILAGTEGNGIYISTNFGNSWLPKNSGLTNLYLQYLATNDSEVFAGTYGGGIFHTIDNGNTWNQINNGIPNCCAVFSIATAGNVIFSSVTGNGVFISMDNGNNWYENNNGLSTETDIKSLITYWSNCFAGLDGKGVYQYDNIDSVWSPINSGLPNNVIVNDMKIMNNYLIIGTANDGVWKRPLNELITNVDQKWETEPKDYKLLQNYPNPFNPTTTVKYSLPESNQVHIKLYDILGREIQTILDEYKLAGIYEVEFSAKELPSGVYFYKMESGNFSKINKMVLVK